MRSFTHFATVPSPVGENPVGPGDEIGMDEYRHDCLDPAPLRPTRRRGQLLRRSVAFDMYEQPWEVQVGVASQVEIVDRRAFENGSLLRTDVRREQEDFVTDVGLAQAHSSTIQLVDDDADVLMPQVRLLLDEVTNRPFSGPPCDDAVESGPGLPGRADLGLRYPFLESSPVRSQVGCIGGPSHVYYFIVFINNEQHGACTVRC